MTTFAKVFTVCLETDVGIVNRTFINIPDEAMDMESYPSEMMEDMDKGDWISEEEWIELKKIHTNTTNVSEVVSMEELDIVFGKDASYFPEMKEKIVEYWAKISEGPDRPDMLRQSLECTSWNGHNVQF